MGIDLDPWDEIFPEHATNNARTGGKFRPKGKPQPSKESLASVRSTQSVQTVDIAENELLNLMGPSLATSETKKPFKDKEDYVSEVNSPSDCPFVNPLLEHIVTGETLGHNISMHSDGVTPNVNRDWHFSIGKSAGQNADVFFGLECLDDFYSQSTTATGRSPHKVDQSVQLGNEFLTSCPANNGAEGSLAHSEIPTVYVSDTRSAEEGPRIPVVSPLDDSAVMLCNASSSNTCPEVSLAQDPLTCGEAVVSNSDGGFHIDNRRLEIEEGEAVPCLETLDNVYELTTRSGRCSGKFQPKPTVQIQREKPGTDTSHPDAFESVPCRQQAQSIPSETDYMNEGSNPAFPPNNIVDFPSLRFDDSTSELPVNKPTNFMEASCSEASFLGEHPEAVPKIPEKNVSQRSKCRKRKTPVSDDSLEHRKDSVSGQENEAGRSTRHLRKQKHVCELVDDSEDEVHDDGDFSNECPSGSLVDEDENDDGEYQVENEPQNRKAPTKSKKSVPQKEKHVWKRQKANKVVEQSTKEPPKKFSHSTHRKRRQVDRVLLDTPEDEIDIQNLCIRDIILLAEHRERLSSKLGKTSEAPLANQSASNSVTDYNEDETFASDQGVSNNDETNPTVQESYTNYQSYMEKTPRSRWSKQDTELFYEAVRQFGSDISMIQQLFPGRTRNQVKLKYKKEERQHPLRLHDALTNRAKDHSHFQVVIERLQKLAAEDKQNSYREDSFDLTGVEEGEEEVAKSEQVEAGEVEAMEPDASEGESPLKSYDSEDDLCAWSQYKSEL